MSSFGKYSEGKVNIKLNKLSMKIFFAALSGVLGFAAFPPLDLSFLGWVCLVPLFLALENTTKKQALMLGYVTGVVFFSGLLYWLVNVTFPGTVILVLYLGIFFCAFSLAARFIIKNSLELLILPFLWVILEFIRANLFSGFPWGLLGYSQYMNLNVIQIADLTGAYGVSFLIVGFNSALFAWVTRSKRKVSYMMVALLFILISVSYSRYKLDNYEIWASPKASVIQGNIPQELKWDGAQAVRIISVYKDLSLQAAREDPDIILWPETAYPYLVGEDMPPVKTITQLGKEFEVPLLAGCVTDKGDVFYNSAVFFKNGQIDEIYNKTHLVPFGEYIPFKWLNDLLRRYVDKPIGDFSRGKEYTLFSLTGTSIQDFGQEIIKTTGYYKFGVLICFEDVFPYLSRRFVKDGANFLVNITNDAWFKKTAAARQHMQASVFRAVENRVPVVRAANTGISCFIDSTGKIRSILENKSGEDIFVRGILTDEIEMSSWRSFYTFYGDSFVLFCMVMLIILFSTEGYFLLKGTKSNNPLN